MKLKVFPLLILIAIVVEIIFLVLPKNKITPLSPLMFWLLGAVIVAKFVWVWKQLSRDLKLSNPKIFKKYAIDVFGKLRLPRTTFNNQEVLDVLSPKAKELLKAKDYLIPYFFICFVLFALSGFLMVLK